MNNQNSQLLMDSVEASLRFQQLMSGLLPTLIFSLRNFDVPVSDSSREEQVREARHFLNGSIIVYLFSMWDSYFSHECIDKYFRDNEKKKFYAFKHLRIVAAHNIDGSRRGNRRDRMDHAEKLDEIMNSNEAIKGLVVTQYNLNMSDCFVALDCQSFLSNMALLLSGCRISVGGAYGKIKTRGPDGISYEDVM